MPRLGVCLFLFVRLLNRTKAEPSSEGHSVLFVEPDCLSPSLCWCKLNRLIFLSPIKYSSQLDLAVCINVINYNRGEKNRQFNSQLKVTNPVRENKVKKNKGEEDKALMAFKMFFFFVIEWECIWRCLSLILPHMLYLGGIPPRAQCGLFQRLSGNATITDHRPSKTRVVLGL